MPTTAGTRPSVSAALAPSPAAMLVSALAIPGRPEHVQAAREFTALALRVHGRDDDGISGLLVSEVVTNSLIHSDSGRPGGTITVRVIITPGESRVEVADDGGDGEPVPRTAPGDADAEDGRGLFLLQELADEWGHFRQGGRLITWFTLRTGRPA
jgi:anti-sigma regulatory factor (Ser/Thr protein kinase)